jgi:uncharacterized protein YggE
MRKSLAFGIGVALVSLCSVFAQVYGQAAPPTITVSGTGEVKVVPDEVILRIGVESRNSNLMEAKAQNDAAVSKTLAFLRKEVEPKHIQTDFISFEQIYDSGDRIKPAAYWARNSIEVKLTDLKKLDGVIAGVMTNGVNTIHGIEFRTSELRKHRDAARAMAIKAAIEKADAAAKELGVKRGKVYNLNMSEGGWGYYGSNWGSRYSYSNMSQNAMQVAPGGGQDSEGSLSAGQISVSASVAASFLVN